MSVLAEGVLLHLELWRAKVDQEPVLDPRCAKVADQLRDMLIHDGSASFDLHNQFSFDEKVREEFAKDLPVLIAHG